MEELSIAQLEINSNLKFTIRISQLLCEMPHFLTFPTPAGCVYPDKSEQHTQILVSVTRALSFLALLMFN